MVLLCCLFLYHRTTDAMPALVDDETFEVFCSEWFCRDTQHGVAKGARQAVEPGNAQGLLGVFLYTSCVPRVRSSTVRLHRLAQSSASIVEEVPGKSRLQARILCCTTRRLPCCYRADSSSTCLRRITAPWIGYTNQDVPRRRALMQNATLANYQRAGAKRSGGGQSKEGDGKSKEVDIYEYSSRVLGHRPMTEYSLWNCLCYLFYAPLYLAGPTLTFNAFVSQVSGYLARV